MPSYPYDAFFDPPAPVLPVQVSRPLSLAEHAVRALVDSGADVSFLPNQLADVLSLRRAGEIPVSDVFGSRTFAVVFLVSVAVEGKEPRTVEVVLWDHDYVLLGRDIINHWKVTLDGPRSSLGIE